MKTLRMLFSPSAPMVNLTWCAIPLRLIVGYGFIFHGYAKLAKGPEHFAVALQALGVPAPTVMAWMTLLVELFGGFAILIGAFVALASIPMAIVLIVAIFTVHLPYGFNAVKLQAVTAAGAQFGPPGYETDLLYLACLVALALGGPGPLAVGTWLANRSAVKKGHPEGSKSKRGPGGEAIDAVSHRAGQS